MTQSCFSLKTTSTPPSFDSDNPPDYSIMPGGGGAVGPGADSIGSQWISTPCNPKARYRYTDDGHIEVEGQGAIRAKTWPSEVDSWRSLIEQAADANEISRALLAAIVAVGSEGKPNHKGAEGQLGLTQLHPKVASSISGTNDLPESMILNPSWNLLHGAKLMSFLVDEAFARNEEDVLVGPMAAYNRVWSTSKTESYCSDEGCDPHDRWGLWTDCGYIDNVIAHINTAIDHGYSGPRQIDLGVDQNPSKDSSSIWPYVLFIGAGAAMTAMVLAGKKRR